MCNILLNEVILYRMGEGVTMWGNCYHAGECGDANG